MPFSLQETNNTSIMILHRVYIKRTHLGYYVCYSALSPREINVNHIKSYELTLDRGGNTVMLKEGKDYTVVKSESEE